MDSLNFNSVETLPNLSARAAFQVNSSAVFKEDVHIVPVIIDNNMPFDILKLIEDDETLSTCQMFKSVAKSEGHFIVGCTPLAHTPQLQCSMFFIPLDCLKNPTNNQFFFP